MKIIHAIRPVIGFIPEIERPRYKQQFNEKILYTLTSLLIYMFASNIPMYGIQRATTSDPFYWMRVILASNTGTLMELGVSPLVTTGMVLQLLTGAKILDVNKDSKEDRVLFMALQKLVGLATTFVMAVVYVASGMYGEMSSIGMGNSMLIVAQLTCAGLMVLMLDEMLNKGWGLGSAISLFIAGHICETVAWQAFSPTTVITGRGVEFEGAILALFHVLYARKNKLYAIAEALFRQNLPNISNLVATAGIFFACNWLMGMKVMLTVKHQKARGLERPYPIKFFYASNMPIVLHTCLISNIYFISQTLYNQQPNSPFIGLFGKWAAASPDMPSLGHSVPVGGLAYYVSPPANLSAMLHEPFHACFYFMFTLTACAIFGKTWTEVSGTSVRHVSKQMRENHILLKGYRDTATSRVLSRYIPIAAALGGACVGALSVVADYAGAIGTGTGILLTVMTIYDFYEAAASENQGQAMKALMSQMNSL